ncbi:glycosyl transferase [Staphylococcus gallinarum]|jgi:MGT family glycosyltransferase|uniref:Glycosyl transferase n=1 Tax=Staphylococcus gallinarum TaxID=1293 RepID=A0A3A0H176_STAGA|nr:macrolide family glycosyltransferase [Staphylococcus gallinarum]MCD8909508.1 glycosyl transferase [Staphylococcus gallinarum]MCQ9288107.1 glycosyl transferase [Staphylococcus gallinarum]RIL21490.1 glycosyl transferase [Staphylococcus gallinarum]RIL25184.1 glycosyl transferase [Staphylococcus gallinarum]RIL29380.1 glycosyl transferase [Staphylococcus gallinarum]
MARVLFINPGPSGHINPTAALCKELVARGEEIVYYASDQFQDKLNDTGVEIRTFNTDEMIEAFREFGKDNLYQVVNGLLNTVDMMLPRLIEETKDEHYDYMIYDSMFGCGRLLAQKLNIPAISSVTSFAHNKESFDQFLNAIAATIDSEDITKSDAHFETLRKQIEAKYDVSVPNRFEVMYNPGDLHLSYIMKKFQLDYQSFDNSQFYFAGPSVLEPTDSGFMDELDTSRPVIYISLGTIFNQNIPFFNKCFTALKDIDATVVVSIGNENSLDDFNEVPSNFIIKPTVPQVELLQHTSLFLTHAGMNSTNEAMKMGVPMLAFPQSADQPVVSKQIEDLGLGQRLDAETMTPAELQQTVQAMLEHLEQYKANIANIKDDQHSDKPGYVLAADRIFEFRNEFCPQV